MQKYSVPVGLKQHFVKELKYNLKNSAGLMLHLWFRLMFHLHSISGFYPNGFGHFKADFGLKNFEKSIFGIKWFWNDY